MQIIRTHVERATASSGHPVVRVQFCGEEGDCVTVDMRAVDDADEAIAMERARAILVQTARFDSATNDYDAESNGNFDEIALTSASDDSGEVFVFEYRDGESFRQIPPCTMPSRQAAHEEAVRCAVDLLLDLQPGQDPLSGWLVRVRGEDGAVLCTIDVQEAEAARRARQ